MHIGEYTTHSKAWSNSDITGHRRLLRRTTTPAPTEICPACDKVFPNLLTYIATYVTVRSVNYRKGASLKSLVFGSAYEVPADDPITEHNSVRVYRAGVRTFIGHDSWHISHVCNDTCTTALIEAETKVAWIKCKSTDDYISLSSPGKRLDGTYYPTVDVVDFDPGDDPYILCAACNTELLRDEEKFEEQYGRKIGE